MKRLFLLFITASLFIVGCETDVDLTAPYDSTTIVYSLLDPIQDTQWIKINRTFLGEGNNLDYALIRDSSEYKSTDFNSITVQEIVGSNVTNTFTVHEKEVSNKSINGIFYGPTQTVYYFTKPGGLNVNASYRINIDFVDKEDVTAITTLVDANSIQFQAPEALSASGSAIRLALSTGPLTFNFGEFNRAIITDESAPFYEVALRMHLTEKEYTDASHTTLVASRPVTIEYFSNRYFLSQSNDNIPSKINGEAFFDYLGRNLKHDDNIVYQIGEFKETPFPGTYCFDLVLYFGGDELYTYYQVNNPTTGIAQERPTYSNVQNGLGLWSSRSERVIKDLPIVTTSPSAIPAIGNLIALRYSTYTQGITFCDPGSEAVDLISACPN